MRKTVLLIGLLTMLGVQAQKLHQRSEYTFKRSLLKNEKGEMTHVKVDVLIGKKVQDSFTSELPGVPDAAQTETIGTIDDKTDLNFDGYPDVRIYLGYWGARPNDSYYDALIWDQEHKCFLQATGFSELPDPMVDDHLKLIYTTGHNGPEQMQTDYYRFRRNKIELVRTNNWNISDAHPTDFSQLLNLPCYRIDAKFDGRFPVTIVYQTDYDIVAGYIYYPKAKNPAPIMIAGTIGHYEDNDFMLLSEYQSDGIITGNLYVTFKGHQENFEGVEGKWSNPKTDQSMTITDISYSREMPHWFTESLLKPEDPGNVGKRYSFQEWNMHAQSMMGGHVTFRAAGKNKVHFEVCNAHRHIAEGASAKGRPAVLHGNTFEYREVNDCHYGFMATFFPRFVVLQTITDTPTDGCFGMGASFDGVYIKVEQ